MEREGRIISATNKDDSRSAFADWTAAVNRSIGRIALAPGVGAEVRQVAYSAHLPDNIPHRHTYFEVCQVGERGSGQFLVGGISYPIGPGDVFWARPSVLHQIVNTANEPLMELYWTAFALDIAPRGDGKAEKDEVTSLLRALAESDIPLVTPARDTRPIAALWRALRVVGEHAAASPETSVGLPAQLSVLIAALLLALARAGVTQAGDGAQAQNASPHSDHALAARAAWFIHARLGSGPLAIPVVADHIGVSPRHLARLFAAFAGTSPAAYIERARLDRAAALLRRTDDPLKQIASQVGYASIHHFTRAFTRHFACPPGAYRANGPRAARADQTNFAAEPNKPGALV